MGVAVEAAAEVSHFMSRVVRKSRAAVVTATAENFAKESSFDSDCSLYRLKSMDCRYSQTPRPGCLTVCSTSKVTVA